LKPPLFLLIFATAVTGIAKEVGIAQWENLQVFRGFVGGRKCNRYR